MVAVLVAAVYEQRRRHDRCSSACAGRRSRSIIVAGSIASMKVTRTLVVVSTPDAPANGFTDFTVGAVTSGPLVVLKTTSTK